MSQVSSSLRPPIKGHFPTSSAGAFSNTPLSVPGPVRTLTENTSNAGCTQTVGSTKFTGTGVFVRVMVGVGEIVGVKVCVDVGVAVSGSVGRGVKVADAVKVGESGVGGGVTGENGLRITKSNIVRRTSKAPIERYGFLVIMGGNFLESLFSPEAGTGGCGAVPSATNKFLNPVS